MRELYFKSSGKLIKVTGIFTDVLSVNNYCNSEFGRYDGIVTILHSANFSGEEYILTGNVSNNGK
jgi:hypothetical protein